MAWLSKCKDMQGSSEVASWMETQGGISHVQPLSKSEQNSGVRHLGAGAPLRGGKLWVLLPQGGSDGSSWLRSLAGNVPCLFIS